MKPHVTYIIKFRYNNEISIPYRIKFRHNNETSRYLHNQISL